jgi:hypothetical protein
MQQTVSIYELAQMCHRSVRTIRRWKQQGRITPISEMLPDRFGKDTLRLLGLEPVAPMESVRDRHKRAAKALEKKPITQKPR